MQDVSTEDAMINHQQWIMDHNLCSRISGPPTNPRRQITSALNKRYAKDWFINITSIRRSPKKGIYVYYLVEYNMRPREGWIGGSMEDVFQFVRDKEDASMASAEL